MNIAIEAIHANTTLGSFQGVYTASIFTEESNYQLKMEMNCFGALKYHGNIEEK